MKNFSPTAFQVALSAGLLLLGGCGAGGGSASSATATTTATSATTATSSTTSTTSSLLASSTYAQQCDPTNPDAPAANKTASLTTEKQWMRSYFNEAYLWYDQVPVVDPTASAYTGSMATLAAFNVPQPLSNYFQALKTPQLTASGATVDKFSFTYSTADWTAYSQSGQSGGYGMNIALVSKTVPRKAVVALTDPGTPAAANAIGRGAQIVTIDGVDLVNTATTAGVNTLNAGLSPTTGTTHVFGILDLGSSTPRNVTMTAQTITTTPVQNVQAIATSTGKVGYMLFNDQIASSEQLLINAVNTLKANAVTDLVLDLRYNGGGYLFIASELAYMIAGPARTYNGTTSLVFDKLTYNAKRSSDTNSPNSTTAFYNTSCILGSNGCTGNATLPNLGLSTVYVLTQSGTCSASEAIINGLRGVGVAVKLIGGTTCGKPYGFTAKDNCGVSYFPIEFKGVNAQGFGDFSDGFAPNCAVSDDFTKQLGDPTEAMLAGALTVRATGLCPGGAALKSLKVASDVATSPDYVLLKHPVRENLWLLPDGGSNSGVNFRR